MLMSGPARSNSLVPRQGVHHNGGGLGTLQQVVVDDVHVLDRLVLVLAGESFPVTSSRQLGALDITHSMDGTDKTHFCTRVTYKTSLLPTTSSRLTYSFHWMPALVASALTDSGMASEGGETKFKVTE